MRRWNGDVFGKRLLMVGLGGALTLSGAMLAQSPGATDGDTPAAQAPSQPGGHHGQYAGMGHVAGEVTSVAGAVVTVRAEDGSTVQIVTTDNTRVVKANGPVKVSDLHPGDGLMAVGNLDPATHALHAAMVMAEDAAEVKAMRENLGKTYITGRVTAVDLDDAKMTVERPDHVAQTIGLDESTSFKRAVRGERPAGAAGANPNTGEGGSGGGFRGGGGMGAGGIGGPGFDRAFANGESITLADIKVGDSVLGTGALKGGVFVPKQLMDRPRGQRRQGSGAPAAAGAAAPATPPAGTGPDAP